MKIGFYRDRVVMPTCFLRSLVLANHRQARVVKRQACVVEDLRERLESRENVLRRALQELAMLRGERDPQDWMQIQARYGHPRNPGGRPRTS